MSENATETTESNVDLGAASKAAREMHKAQAAVEKATAALEAARGREQAALETLFEATKGQQFSLDDGEIYSVRKKPGRGSGGYVLRRMQPGPVLEL
jgi:outer membrane protein TolC